MEAVGVLAAMASSALGGTAIGATRYLAGSLDPITIGALRFGGGFAVLAPVAFGSGRKLPGRGEWPAVAGLGLLFFGLFPILFNAALIYTTAARGALALSTLPLLTIAVGACLGSERPTARRMLGVLIAMGGVGLALGSSLDTAPPAAWRGDLLMVSAASCMALYTVWSRPFVDRFGPLLFAALGMGLGAAVLAGLSVCSGGVAPLVRLSAPQWVAIAYLAIVCGAAIFFLWAFAIGRAPASLVSVSVTVNPIAASVVGLTLLGEPVPASLIAGLIAVLAGIAVAIASGSRASRDPSP